MSNSDYNNELLDSLSKKLGKSQQEIADSAKSGDISSLLGGMSQKQRDKVNSILSDPEATRRLMENPQVQALIKKFGSNG